MLLTDFFTLYFNVLDIPLNGVHSLMLCYLAGFICSLSQLSSAPATMYMYTDYSVTMFILLFWFINNRSEFIIHFFPEVQI
ncbi:hypothetical protein BJY04DRAFT_35176 [Aspergillus karnatakaensis]|uniref:uncharacterized protein n=1 Tax=Aspergillus karnatakaensis TaxID=1810916 RepID=UPI003CCDF30D